MADSGDENTDSGDASFDSVSTYTQKEVEWSGSDGESLQLRVTVFKLIFVFNCTHFWKVIQIQSLNIVVDYEGKKIKTCTSKISTSAEHWICANATNAWNAYASDAIWNSSKCGKFPMDVHMSYNWSAIHE